MKVKRVVGRWACGVSLAMVVISATGGAAAQRAAALGAGGQSGPRRMLVVFGQGTTPLIQDDLFNGTEKFAKGASDVTEVTMDPDTLGMVDGKDAKRAHGMVLNVVRTYEYDKPGMYRMEDVEEFRKKLNTGDWRCSVHIRDFKSGESTDVCNRHHTDGLIEQATIIVEPKSLTFIHQIKHPSDRSGSEFKGGSSDGSGMLMMPGMDAKMAAMEATMAAKEPEMEAMGEVMQAKMAALQPEIEARMAGMGQRIGMVEPDVERQLKDAQKSLKDAQTSARPSPTMKGDVAGL